MLENKLGITDPTKLARAEEKISKRNAIEMFENGFLEKLEPGTYESLAAIHKYLFDEIYDFAGKIRKVNLSKGNFRFVPRMYLEAALQSIDKMPQSTFDEIIEKYVEMNVAHPFREGNGRSLGYMVSNVRLIFLRYDISREQQKYAVTRRKDDDHEEKYENYACIAGGRIHVGASGASRAGRP